MCGVLMHDPLGCKSELGIAFFCVCKCRQHAKKAACLEQSALEDSETDVIYNMYTDDKKSPDVLTSASWKFLRFEDVLHYRRELAVQAPCFLELAQTTDCV
jgi:hypothetical protein